MTREEIREGIGRHIGFGIVKDVPLDEIVGSVLSYLHSQGVVIKVDRELPQVTISDSMSDEDKYYKETVWGYAQDTMLKAGYVAVEPLIEICEHNWIKLRNEVITAGEICTKCKAIRPEGGD